MAWKDKGAKALSALVVISAVLFTSSAYGVEIPSKIDPDASCVTAECHATMGKLPHVHEPVVQGECQICHRIKGNTHRFEEMADSPSLCAKCHDRVDTKPIVHLPAANDCSVCHDSHSSQRPGLLKGKDDKELCFGCHDAGILDGEYQHGPAAVGACSICHEPHSSAEEKLLKASGNGLCAICHPEWIEEMTSSRYVHEPVTKSCASCHDPHSGSQSKVLSGSAREMCGKCHEEVVKAAAGSSVHHSPAESENGCLDCHTPHGSNSAAQLKAPQVELCLGCHNKQLKAENTTLIDMNALLAENKNRHGPIREGGCTGCHQPHGGANFRLLTEPFPPKFYSPYNPANYALCYTCHEPTVVKDQYTKTLTGFRDGDLNLHFLHVNKPKRGRTCRACHEAHASQHPRHVRDSVPYGQWELPINFTKTETGGSCQPGCHGDTSYDRNKR